jgi:dTDP-6-deoxy-L-talose 4-dehydrogenase (NAD+)
MKVLVTGATGFLGQQVVAQLLAQGHEVVASSLHAEKASSAVWYGKVTYHAFNLNELYNGNVYTYFGSPDVLMHLAWEGLPDFNNPIHLEQNLLAQQHFLTAYIQGGGRHIVCTGTCLEYGMKTGALSEDMEAAPICSYAIAKNRLRQYLEALQQKNDFLLQWVRVFYLYGRGQNAKALLPQLEQAVQRGDKVFNMSGGAAARLFESRGGGSHFTAYRLTNACYWYH